MRAMLRRTFLGAAGAGVVLPAAAQQGAASWPTRPVRILVGFAPGGTADILARQLQKPLTALLGQPVVVENRSGASGITAASQVARAGPDGTTFGLVVSTHASLPAIRKTMPYDTEKDFAPVAFIGSIPLVLMVGPQSPWHSLPELVAAARAKPGSLHYGIPGVGLSHHFAGELLKQRAGVDIVPVSYRGTAPALTDVMAGQVEMTFGTLPAVTGAIEGGLVRALAITAPQRSARLPAVPTVAELGYPGFDVSEWFGIVAPADTPPEIVARMNAAVDTALQGPELQAWLGQNDVTRGTTTPEGFRALIAAEIAKLSTIAAASHISVD